MAIALDTLEYARRLRESGFSEQQAEGQARALAAAMTDTLATKQDVQQLEARFDALENRLGLRLGELEKRFELRLEACLADLERRMTFRLGAVMMAGIAIFSTMMKLL